ncbi:P-type DNA transfer ATPase VirB11 [Acidiphilium sp.]|uniref:P-type DNA transfer ATPase VirB11 n=1 Tax=Acidiphilium sp. TaxID=527 RepID=UPI003CFE79B1
MDSIVEPPIAESPAAPVLRFLLTPLQAWLDDASTEELCINRPGECWVRQRGVFKPHSVLLDLRTLEMIATLAASLRRQDVGSSSPLCATELPGGERLQICLPPIVPIGTVSLTIRRPGASVAPLSSVGERYQVAGWNQWRSRRDQRDLSALLALFDAGDIEAFLRAAVHHRLTILLCGATGSGKTSMSKTLISAIPLEERIITIEDTPELVIPQPNHVRLLYSKDGQSTARVDAEALLQASLRMRPDRVLLQELRDDAAWTYVNEVVSGHPGSITTIHGKYPDQAFKKLFSLIKGSPKGAGFDDRTLSDLLAAAVDLIIPFETFGSTYQINQVWFAADAARRGETAADLLRAI